MRVRGSSPRQRSGPSRLVRAVLAPGLLLLFVAAGGTDRRADCEAILDQAHKAMEAGRFKEARELLVTKLAEHKDAAYLKPKLESLRADLKTCAFRIAYPRKQLRELIDGVLTVADPKLLQVSIAYDRKDRESAKPARKFPGPDFETKGEDSVSRYAFDGPYSVQFTGTRLGTTPIVTVCREVVEEVEQCYLFEMCRQGLTCLDRLLGAEARNIANSTNTFDVRKPYVMKVAVRDTQIEAFLGGKRVVVGAKEAGHFGRLGFRKFVELERIEISGRLDRAWMEAETEARSAADRIEFEKSWDPNKELPEWAR